MSSERLISAQILKNTTKIYNNLNTVFSIHNNYLKDKKIYAAAKDKIDKISYLATHYTMLNPNDSSPVNFFIDIQPLKEKLDSLQNITNENLNLKQSDFTQLSTALTTLHTELTKLIDATNPTTNPKPTTNPRFSVGPENAFSANPSAGMAVKMPIIEELHSDNEEDDASTKPSVHTPTADQTTKNPKQWAMIALVSLLVLSAIFGIALLFML